MPMHSNHPLSLLRWHPPLFHPHYMQPTRCHSPFLLLPLLESYFHIHNLRKGSLLVSTKQSPYVNYLWLCPRRRFSSHPLQRQTWRFHLSNLPRKTPRPGIASHNTHRGERGCILFVSNQHRRRRQHSPWRGQPYRHREKPTCDARSND